MNSDPYLTEIRALIYYRIWMRAKNSANLFTFLHTNIYLHREWSFSHYFIWACSAIWLQPTFFIARVGAHKRHWWSTCPLAFDCWLLDYVIYLELRKKTLARPWPTEQIHKMTTVFTQNGSWLSFWVKIVAILWIWLR